MKKKSEGTTKEQIVDMTIHLIDSKGGASSVNLREIARRVGCSAPNIYNYFVSMDDLLNTALIRICEDFNTIIKKNMVQINNTKDLLQLAFHSYIKYAVDNPGRLNFYHFEKLNFTISSEAEASARRVGEHMAHLLYTGIDRSVPFEKVLFISNVLHRYILGTLSDYITGRFLLKDKRKYVKELTDTGKRVFNCLVQGLMEHGD